MDVVALNQRHYPEVKNIYETGIASGQATFQTTAPLWLDWDRNHLHHCRIVAIENNSVIGWAALSPVSSREVYAGVAEVSVYVSAHARGRMVGTTLLSSLIHLSEQHNIWTLQSSIFPENEASVALHVRHGFRRVGIREKIGLMGNVWRDTLLFERRSTVTGI